MKSLYTSGISFFYIKNILEKNCKNNKKFSKNRKIKKFFQKIEKI